MAVTDTNSTTPAAPAVESAAPTAQETAASAANTEALKALASASDRAVPAGVDGLDAEDDWRWRVHPEERRTIAATILAGLCAKRDGETDEHYQVLATQSLRAADALIAASAPKQDEPK